MGIQGPFPSAKQALSVDSLALPIGQHRDSPRFAEIDASDQLAHDDDIQAFDIFWLEARGVGQCLKTPGWANIRVKAQPLSQIEQSLLGPLVVRHAPLGSADRPHAARGTPYRSIAAPPRQSV